MQIHPPGHLVPSLWSPRARLCRRLVISSCANIAWCRSRTTCCPAAGRAVPFVISGLDGGLRGSRRNPGVGPPGGTVAELQRAPYRCVLTTSQRGAAFLALFARLKRAMGVGTLVAGEREVGNARFREISGAAQQAAACRVAWPQCRGRRGLREHYSAVLRATISARSGRTLGPIARPLPSGRRTRRRCA